MKRSRRMPRMNSKRLGILEPVLGNIRASKRMNEFTLSKV